VAATTMAKEPAENEKAAGPGGEPAKVLSSLKVRQEDQQIIAKIAALRGISIEVLFMEKDVRTFFRHLLIEETGKERDHQRKQLEAEHRKDRR